MHVHVHMYVRMVLVLCVLMSIKLSLMGVEKINTQSPIDAQSPLNAQERWWLKKYKLEACNRDNMVSDQRLTWSYILTSLRFEQSQI